MVKPSAFERVGLKSCVVWIEACIRVHKARTPLATLEQLPGVGMHRTSMHRAGSSVSNHQVGGLVQPYTKQSSRLLL
jgi:hypothetical protein